ncbi:heavy metal translocating P-type ATPase [Massilia glaciei]|uniref:Cadmium-translocating P-type ATPase n=1 Tax=Massilia glaciei TaxID=1524097 RepID=A0A2U2I4Z6_9BURK|nr:heavy metal translocating P-type ATPase [Massilia glaciei]PWF54797.1 cadmium-translocating P-type ATPase [Massilia glaciei]
MSATPACALCFHCGLPLPAAAAWSVRIDDTPRPMCCSGCEAVAQAIVDNGLTDYYQTRAAFGATGKGDSLVPPQLALYDADPALVQPQPGQDSCEAVFSVEGIRCAACVWLIERQVARLGGIERCDMNVASERLHVRWNPLVSKPSAIIGALHAIGYTVYPYEASRHGQQQERAGKKLFRQLFVAGLSMMQVMMYALPAYIADDGTMEADMAALMRWASLLLTVPAVLYSAQPFLRGAIASLRQGMPGMDVPVVLGIGAAFVASAVATFRGAGEVYFDSVTMFIFLLLASRYLEQHARRKAGRALERLQHGLPASAQRMTGFPDSRATELVAAQSLREGDYFSVAPGESIAADGVIVEGDTEFDLALLTGESRAQPRRVGDEVPGGAVNTSQATVLRVTKAARDSTLARLVALVERAGHGKPQMALWADRVAAWFVTALLVLTVAVFIAWQVVDPARAWQVAIAVLVVSCPCALSLATPSTLAAATDLLVRRGVLIVKPHVLETLHRATHVIFDKTGTLTEGQPVLRKTVALGALDANQSLAIAAALEAGSAHPLAAALRRANRKPSLHALAPHSVAGQGVEGTIDGVRYRLGSAVFTGASEGHPRGGEASHVFLAGGGVPLARFELADALRPDALAVVQSFQRRGQQVVLLSGDAQPVVDTVAGQLGIATALGGRLPAAKLAYVQQLQSEGAVVAMVGDGVNDAAVLSASDVSFAMGGGAALAQLNADCVLLAGRLAPLDEAAVTAGRALRVIRQNLWWASIYNAVAIPAAALGLINPWLSAVGMSASSAVVVINALRLRRWRV